MSTQQYPQHDDFIKTLFYFSQLRKNNKLSCVYPRILNSYFDNLFYYAMTNYLFMSHLRSLSVVILFLLIVLRFLSDKHDTETEAQNRELHLKCS